MTRNFLLMLILAIACEKEEQDDVTVYKWKRSRYRAIHTHDGPAYLPSSDPSIINAIYVGTDFVLLSGAQKRKQQDSIFRASDRILAYKYEKSNH